MKPRVRIGTALAVLVLATPFVSHAAPAQLRAGDGPVLAERAVGGPVSVNVLALPRVDQEPRSAIRPVRAERELRTATPLSARDAGALRAAALAMPPQPGVQIVNEDRTPATLTPGLSFDSLNFDDDVASVPPDPDLAVGPNHIVAVASSIFEVYDKSGNTLVGPTRLDTFFSPLGSLCSGTFNPNALYDEKANRYIMGVAQLGSGPNGSDNRYCVAVSKNSNPAGNWWLYFFDASPNTDEFLDNPRAGVGDEAIFMGGNVYTGAQHSFVRSDVWAFDKGSMYQGILAADPIRHSFPASAFSPQPMRAHGFAQGNWPTGIGHYVIIDNASDGHSIGVYRWTDPFGADTFTLLGSVNLDTATGVTGGLPVDSPQSGSAATLQANGGRSTSSTATATCSWPRRSPATPAVARSTVSAGRRSTRR